MARQQQDNDKTNVETVHSMMPFTPGPTTTNGPGVKGIIGMHRFRFVLSLFCCCLALVYRPFQPNQRALLGVHVILAQGSGKNVNKLRISYASPTRLISGYVAGRIQVVYVETPNR